jgi:peptidoglycan hydrolase-like protein with peptidoglycan-binding domain
MSIQRTTGTTRATAILSGLMAALSACGQETSPAGPDHAPNSRLAALDHDLAPGSRGEDVVAVQEYLTRYGYFPSDELARLHPRWRPLVEQAPPAAVYEARTERALRFLQKNNGLPETGVVDRATREVLRQPRCGYPDGVPPLDPRDKFALISGEPWWNKLSITWRFNPHWLDNIPAETVRTQVANAFGTWASATTLQFTQVPGAADIEISFAFLNSPASSTAPPLGDIQFNWAQSWSTGDSTPSNALDLRSAALHEIGHTLGLAHSSVGSIDNTVMWPGLAGGKQRRSLATDDDLAIQFKGTPWEQLPGCARDIGVLDHFNVWIVDCTQSPPSGKIKKWNASTGAWVADNGNQWAVNIAVDADGRPWTVSGNGTVRRKTSSSATSGSWQDVGGCWQDIGASKWSNDVWATGCNGSADGLIWKFNRALGYFEQDLTNGAARRIGVDTLGRPWVVQASGLVYRRTTSDRTTGWWEHVPGGARDVGVSGSDEGLQAWVIGIHDEGIYMWNQQTAIGDGSEGGPGAPDRNGWVRKIGAAHRISVAPGGPWVVNTAGQIFREQKYW